MAAKTKKRTEELQKGESRTYSGRKAPSSARSRKGPIAVDPVDDDELELEDDEDSDDELEMGKKKAKKPRKPKPPKAPRESADDCVRFPIGTDNWGHHKFLLPSGHSIRCWRPLTPEEYEKHAVTAPKQVRESLAAFVAKHGNLAAQMREFVKSYLAYERSANVGGEAPWSYRWFVVDGKQYDLCVGVHPFVDGLTSSALAKLLG